jgi:branched-chain amino acid transport system permease protein
MLGGFLLGLIEEFCNSIPGLASYTIAIEFGLLILILLVRPTGFLGKKLKEKV